METIPRAPAHGWCYSNTIVDRKGKGVQCRCYFRISTHTHARTHIRQPISKYMRLSVSLRYSHYWMKKIQKMCNFFATRGPPTCDDDRRNGAPLKDRHILLWKNSSADQRSKWQRVDTVYQASFVRESQGNVAVACNVYEYWWHSLKIIFLHRRKQQGTLRAKQFAACLCSRLTAPFGNVSLSLKGTLKIKMLQSIYMVPSNVTISERYTPSGNYTSWHVGLHPVEHHRIRNSRLLGREGEI